MPVRREGPLERRLREAVKLAVRGTRGRNQELAAIVDKPASWVSEYMGGTAHANLDTSLALMRYLGWTLTRELNGVNAPDVDPALLAALRDEETARQLRAFLTLPAETRLALTHLAAAAPTTAQTPRSLESPRGRQGGTHTKSATTRRR